jgi:tetraacyldisaccharide-1-P 4'-kinase
VRFRDHHRFDAADLARVRAAVDAAGAAGAVTTEKDWMRLLPFRPLGLPVAWRGIAARIEPCAAFTGWLGARIGAPAGRRESAA